ncbi:hypothetical protein LJR034_000821 [Caballeronia sp. LjRoot34]|uniref:hypothetical protein n=1 Tax=Caballeronia sp. LjRoot34 TaxID=3342325 RepID=UPI003ED14ECD
MAPLKQKKLWGLLADKFHNNMKHATCDKDDQAGMIPPEVFNVAGAGGFAAINSLPTVNNWVHDNYSNYVTDFFGHTCLI